MWVKIEGNLERTAMILPPEAHFFVSDHRLDNRVPQHCVTLHFLNEGRMANVRKEDCTLFDPEQLPKEHNGKKRNNAVEEAQEKAKAI